MWVGKVVVVVWFVEVCWLGVDEVGVVLVVVGLVEFDVGDFGDGILFVGGF